MMDAHDREHELLRQLDDERHDNQLLVDGLRWKAHDAAQEAEKGHQAQVDERLNDVRLRFIPREVYEKDFDRVTTDIKGIGQRLNAALVGIIMLLLAVVLDIALRQ